ncbi:Pol protein, partial [Globisporangium splendens]
MASIDPAQFPHLSAEHRSVLTRMAQALGDQVALDVLSASPEQQIFRLEQFENFSNTQRLEGERSAQAQMQATASLTAEMLRSAAESREALERVVSVVAGAATSLPSAASAPQTPTSQTPRPRAVKIDAPKFDGADGDKLIHWLLAVERCAKAQLIDSNEQMVSYAISNLRGRASEWHSRRCSPMSEGLPNAARQPRSSRWQIRCGKKRKRNVSVERPASTETDSIASASPTTRVVQMGSLVPGALGNKAPSEMLVYSADVKGCEKKMTVLVDCGASQNFVSKSALKQSLQAYERLVHTGKREKMIVRLADGSTVHTEGVQVELSFSFCDFVCKETFVVLAMGSRYDLILGMPWLAKHQPWIDWRARTVGSSTPSSDEERRLRENFHAMDASFEHAVAGSPAGTHAAAASPAQNTLAVAGSPARRCAEAGSPAKRSTAAGSPVCAEAPESPDVDTGAQVCGSRASEPAPASDSDSTGVHASASSYHPDGAVLELRTARSRVRINRRGRRKLSARERDSALASVAEETAASHMIAPSLNAAATSLRAFDRISDPSIDRAHVDVALRRATRSPEANASDEVFFAEFAALHELPSTVEAIVSLEEMSYELFLTDLERDQIREIVVPTAFPRGELCTSSTADESVLESDKQRRFAAQDWDAVKGSPYFDLWEFKDVFPDKVPSALPVDRGVRHEIDLEPGSKYCVTRQWPLPREQVEAIDEFFAKRALAGHVRESKSPHSSPTFCVRKATGGWRIVHAFNKLNAATIPAQTPIPRKDVLIDSMGGSTVFSALDLMDGFYQILMRESDVPLTAVSTPSGMLWEWLVMPQGLKNAPATFNRLVTHLLRPHRAYAPSYFDDIFAHSRAEGDLSAVDVHKRHLRSVLQCLRDNSLYCNLKKCIFGASEIPILGCYVGKAGVRADPEKIEAIADWPIPKNVKDLRKWLGLANYLHKYSHNYAARVRPLTHLLKKDVEWDWTNDVMNAFIDVKESLVRAPVLALPDHTKAFSVVCDASDFAIGCALMQKDDDGHERVVSYQSRLLKAAEKNYPVHDKELLAIKYALLKFRVHLLGATPFVVYTDHASLRTAINSPHLSQRMARWLAFFSEFNFRVEYKPGKENVLADALSRRPDYESSADSSSDALCLERTPDLMHLSISRVQTKLKDNIQSLYPKDDECRLLIAHFDGSSKESLPAKLESKLARFSYHDGLLWHRLSNFDYPRVYVPHDQDLKLSILHEFHDAPASGHLGREKTFLQVSNVFWWPHQYKWVANYVRSCEQCQRVKPAGKNKAPLHPLPIPQDCWKSVSMDFVFGFPEDKARNTGVVVFVDRLSKMVHVAPVRKHVTAQETACLFLEHVFRYHGLPESIVSDRDPRFTAAFWRELFRLLGTDLALSTADHPETDGQTERVNRVVEDILRSIAVDHPRDWSRWLPYAEFAINSSEHASTAVTPFYFNSLRHPRVPATLFEGVERSAVGGQLAALDASARSPSPDVVSTAHVDARDAPPVRSRSESVTVLPDSTQSIDMSGTVLSYGTRVPKDGSPTVLSYGTRVPIDGSPTVLSYGTRAKNSQSQTESGDCSCERQPRMEGRAVSHTGAEIDLSAARAARATKKQDKAVAARQFVDERAALLRRVRDQLAAAQDKQKLYADKSGRKNKQTFCVGDKVLLSIKNLPNDAVTTLPSGSKLLPRFIGPYTVVEKIGDLNYKLDLPTRMATHPVFYVGLLKRYHDATVDFYPSPGERRSHQGAQTPPIETRARCASPKASSLAERTSRGSASRGHGTPPASDELPSAPSQALSPSASTARFRPDIAGEGYGRLAVAPPKTMRSREPSEPPHLVQPPMLKRSRAPPVPLIDKQGQRHYHVERLLRVQRRKGNTHYLVKWRGYDVSQSSWEPAERLLEDVPDMVTAFERSVANVRAVPKRFTPVLDAKNAVSY